MSEIKPAPQLHRSERKESAPVDNPRERSDTSYVTLFLLCGHTARTARASKSKKGARFYCRECTNGVWTLITEVKSDDEWMVRCQGCSWVARSGQSLMKADRYASRHAQRRNHSVRIYHEKDPEGTERYYGNKPHLTEGRDILKEILKSGDPNEPPPF